MIEGTLSMADYRPRHCSLILGLVLIAVAGIPRAGAQGLSGDETLSANVNSEAGRLADKVADQLKSLFIQQGWIVAGS